MGLNMQRFWALEQISVVLSKLPAILPADMPYNDRRNPSYAVQRLSLRDRRSRAASPVGDLSRIGDIAKRYPLSRAAPDETILPKPCSAYLSAIGAHGLRPIIIKIPTPTHFCASTSMQVTVFSLLHGLSLTCTFIL